MAASGKFVVTARHPWANSDEKYVFEFVENSIGGAKAKAQALIQNRTASGFTCSLHREQVWDAETFRPTVEVSEKPTASLHDDFRKHLEADGARFIDQTIEYLEGGLKLSEISRRDHIPYATLNAALTRNARCFRRLQNRRDNERLRLKHEKLVGQIRAAIDRGNAGLVDLFYTVIDKTLVQQLKENGIQRVDQLQQGIDLIQKNRDHWMPNDLDYLTFTKGRVDQQDWEKAFPILAQAWHLVMPYPEWGEE